MPSYQVQFISSGIVAVTMPTKALAQSWIDANGYGPDIPLMDEKTGELTGEWGKGECLYLFKIVRVKG